MLISASSTRRRCMAFACLLFALAWLATTPLLAGDAAQQFRELYEKEWEFRLNEFPTLASSVGRREADGKLGAVSLADEQRRYEFWKQLRQSLDSIDCEELGRADCINYRIFRRQLDARLSDFENQAYLMPFNSDWAYWIGWTRLPGDARLESTEDYRNYLSRLADIPRVNEEYLALMRRGLELGFTQPRVVLEGRDAAIEKQLVDKTEDSVFYQPFQHRPDAVSEADWMVLRNQASQIISERVLPAYSELLGFMREEYLPGARESLAATELPGGERYYADQVRYYATLDMSAEQIHQLGLTEVARIRAEMADIIERLGFEGSFEEFLTFLRTDPQFYATTPKQLLAEASYFAKKIDGRLPSLFGRLPRQPYGVAPVPGDIAPFFTTGRAVGAPLDARRGGYYWVNTYNLPVRPLYAIPALTLHEAAPGHLTQGALAQEASEQPPFRRHDYISAYGEGWALYAEKLGLEMDIYEDDYQQFGRLTYEMWRACRLVIDTGLHQDGWTRQQAIDYLAGNSALSLHNVTTEVDRYISWPAQALSYKLGEYTILQLRAEAEQKLAGSFDLRDFHDFVLSLGSVPLDVLQDEVRWWIGEQLASG